MKWYDRKYRHEITKCMARQRRWRQAAHSMVPSTNKDLPTQCFWQIRLDVIHQVLGLLVHVLSDPFRAWFLILNNWLTKKKKWRQLSQRRLWSCLGIHYKITFEWKVILPEDQISCFCIHCVFFFFINWICIGMCATTFQTASQTCT